ncbi:MAG: 5-formyltetrahydrofolate cyclo-ligase [Nitrospirota bacterium]
MKNIDTNITVDDRCAVLEKVRIRKRIKEQRDRLSRAERREKSRKIKKRLFALDDFLLSMAIHFFVSFGSEVETAEIIKEAINKGKRVAVPITEHKHNSLILSQINDYDKELETGHWGILEPRKKYLREVNIDDIELMVLPGVVFDEKGNRIGYGKGYYDRLLSGIKGKIPLVGLCYEMQVLKEIPSLHYDIIVDKIITEERVIDINNSG